jgi:hypothetical protein
MSGPIFKMNETGRRQRDAGLYPGTVRLNHKGSAGLAGIISVNGLYL